MKTGKAHSLDYPMQQRGITLVVSLVILLMMMVIGITAIRLINSEERMATHFYDRTVAFQAVEAALRSVEQKIDFKSPVPPAKTAQSADCSEVEGIMLCQMPDQGSSATAVDRWADKNFSSWKALDSYASGAISVTPDYFVEYLGNTFPCNPGDADVVYECKRYRVTARVKGGAGRASVILQSIYATD